MENALTVLTDDHRFELKIRIETVQGSVRRSRLAFLALNLASLALLLLVWNSYFSWFRFFVRSDINPTTDFLKAEFVRNWVRSLWTPASTLGVNIGAADTSLVGSVILLILALWFYFSSRRENHTTARLLADTLDIRIATIRRAVFWAIADEHIFLSWVRNDRPAGAGQSLRACKESPLVERPDRVVRGALSVLALLPLYTIAASWMMDVASLFQPSILRDRSRPLYAQLSSGEWFAVSCILCISGLLAILLGYLLFQIRGFNTDTVQQLRDFAIEVDEIPNPPQSPAKTIPAPPPQWRRSLSRWSGRAN